MCVVIQAIANKYKTQLLKPLNLNIMNLLTPNKTITLYASQGMGYIKNAKGKSSNLMLSIFSTLNTSDNTISGVTYKITAFDWEINESFVDYNTALNRYNELLTELDGHRVIETYK